jgi:ParB family transcriptional regulator, chromosome partitioning protein
MAATKLAMEIEIKKVPPSALSPNPWNSNVVAPEAEEKLKESITRFGLFKPIVVRELNDGSLQIIGGEHRWDVAKKIGMAEVPIVNLGKITDKRAKEIGLVDNGRYGQDDAIALSELIEDLGGISEVIDFLPGSAQDFEDIFKASNLSLDELGLDDDGSKSLSDLASTKSAPTHQIMRFKVPVGDADHVTRLIERTMREQGFKEEDSLSNAGNALVHLLKDMK